MDGSRLRVLRMGGIPIHIDLSWLIVSMDILDMRIQRVGRLTNPKFCLNHPSGSDDPGGLASSVRPGANRSVGLAHWAEFFSWKLSVARRLHASVSISPFGAHCHLSGTRFALGTLPTTRCTVG